MWKMFRPENAIEAMSVTVTLGEPLGSVVSKRILRELERTTIDAGLTDRQPIQQLQLHLNGDATDVQRSSSNGMVFQRNSLLRGEDNVVRRQLAQQLMFNPQQIIFQTWRYRRWNEECAEFLKIITPALEGAADNVTVQSFRLEYVDRFLFEGALKAPISGLLQHSEFLASHIFESEDMWHSHTGRFANVTADQRDLHQVNADMQDLAIPHPLAGARTLALLTAVERQFLPPGLELERATAVAETAKIFENLHTQAIDLFKRVVDAEFRRDNELPQ